MNPPGIGEALNVGWEKFKENPAPILVGMLCAMLLGLIPIVGGFLALPGALLVGLKAVRGQVPEAKDGFAGLNAAVDNIVMGLLQLLGVIACCIGIYVTQGIFMPGTGLIVDKGLSWSEAKDRCLEHIKPQWLSWTLFVFVMGLIAGLGTLACIVGVLVTAPVAVIALAYAYDQTLARS
jgi:hypothetical protein